MAMYNPELMALAEWRLNELKKEADSKSNEKRAFIPPGGGQDPSAGGGDPSGGAGGAPMDPAAMGGAPPDPSMGGGAMGGPPPVPGGGGLDPNSLTQMITQAVQQAMGGGMAGGMGGGAGGMAGKPMKANLESVAMDIFQVKKLIIAMFNTMGMPLPPDILDGPNRDPSTGMPMAPGAPGSTSDPAMSQQGGQQGAPPGGGSAIPPMQPMAPAGPGAEGGGGAPPPAAGGGMPPKMGSDRGLHVGQPHSTEEDLKFDSRVVSRASALAAICRHIAKE